MHSLVLLLASYSFKLQTPAFCSQPGNPRQTDFIWFWKTLTSSLHGTSFTWRPLVVWNNGRGYVIKLICMSVVYAFLIRVWLICFCFCLFFLSVKNFDGCYINQSLDRCLGAKSRCQGMQTLKEKHKLKKENMQDDEMDDRRGSVFWGVGFYLLMHQCFADLNIFLWLIWIC